MIELIKRHKGDVLAVIPARYESSRFPGKPLALISGKPMVQHVWERASEVSQIGKVVVATDDARIQAAGRIFNGEIMMTSPHHPSGTDRVWEVAEAFPGFELIMNIQGDEPFIEPSHLQAAIEMMAQCPQASIVTLVTPIREGEEQEKLRNPNVVKAVMSKEGRVLYFSRAPIPYVRDPENDQALAYHHLGLYLFRRNALERFTTLPPSPLEKAEKLEQLRALEDGMKIYAAVVDRAPVGIDTPEDLDRLIPVS